MVTLVRSVASRGWHAALNLLPLSTHRSILYAKTHRRWPNLTNPRLFSEKVNWRIVNDRRPLLEWTCDKLAMKEHLADAPHVHVPETFWSGTDLADLADRPLPDRWVMKPNHRSGVVHIGGGRAPSLAELHHLTKGWLKPVQSDGLGEWAYSRAQRAILVEEWIGDGDQPPEDYKYFTFGGEPLLVEVHTNRYVGHRCNFYRTPDWTPVDITGGYPSGTPNPRPRLLEEMLGAAAKIGECFDFMRVDLYATSRGVVLGETTPYPGGGRQRFLPVSYDAELGEAWELPPL